MGNGSGNNYLSGSIHVGCGKSDFVGSGNYFIWLSSEDGAHAGGCEGGSVRHGPTPLPDEDHGLLGGEDASGGGGGDLANAVTCPHRYTGECLGGVGEKSQQGDQAGPNEQWLRDGRVADRLGVGAGAMLNQVDTAHDG